MMTCLSISFLPVVHIVKTAAGVSQGLQSYGCQVNIPEFLDEIVCYQHVHLMMQMDHPTLIINEKRSALIWFAKCSFHKTYYGMLKFTKSLKVHLVQFLRKEIQMMRHHSRNFGFKFQVNWSNRLDT